MDTLDIVNFSITPFMNVTIQLEDPDWIGNEWKIIFRFPTLDQIELHFYIHFHVYVIDYVDIEIIPVLFSGSRRFIEDREYICISWNAKNIKNTDIC